MFEKVAKDVCRSHVGRTNLIHRFTPSLNGQIIPHLSYTLQNILRGSCSSYTRDAPTFLQSRNVTPICPSARTVVSYHRTSSGFLGDIFYCNPKAREPDRSVTCSHCYMVVPHQCAIIWSIQLIDILFSILDINRESGPRIWEWVYRA